VLHSSAAKKSAGDLYLNQKKYKKNIKNVKKNGKFVVVCVG
jgi:hypothetical protein